MIKVVASSVHSGMFRAGTNSVHSVFSSCVTGKPLHNIKASLIYQHKFHSDIRLQ